MIVLGYNLFAEKKKRKDRSIDWNKRLKVY